MAALPSCIVITCANGTKKVERKVCGGRQEQEHGEERGPRRVLGDFSALRLYRACCVNVRVCLGTWDSLYGHFNVCTHLCVCFSVQLENKRSLIPRGSWE